MINYSPFAFFRTFLEKDIYSELDKFDFYSDESDLLELVKDEKTGNYYLAGEILNIDKVRHIIEYTKLGERVTVSLHDNLKDRLVAETENTIRYIELGFELRFGKATEIESFSTFLKLSLETLTKMKAYEEFDFLKEYINKIENIIVIYSKGKEPHLGNTYSFVLKAVNSKNQKEVLIKLYNLLTQAPSIVECSKDEFINAFTGKQVTNGVKWTVIGKNKETSKVSLFYFIEKLIDAGYIEKSILNDISKYVKYIFRDKYGAELKNLKQSKSTYSKNPESHQRLDLIISSL